MEVRSEIWSRDEKMNLHELASDSAGDGKKEQNTVRGQTIEK